MSILIVDGVKVPCMSDDDLWMRSAADANRELARERAERGDPFHPVRRSKGDKHRHKRSQK